MSYIYIPMVITKGLDKELDFNQVQHDYVIRNIYKIKFKISIFVSISICSQIIFSSHSTEAIAPNKAYLWSRSKCWMRANKANIQHAATKITNMPYSGQWLRL